MKLWFLRYAGDYDELTASVVRAETEEQARQLLADEDSFRHHTKMALDHDKVSCEELAVDGAPGVIVTDVEEG